MRAHMASVATFGAAVVLRMLWVAVTRALASVLPIVPASHARNAIRHGREKTVISALKIGAEETATCAHPIGPEKTAPCATPHGLETPVIPVRKIGGATIVSYAHPIGPGKIARCAAMPGLAKIARSAQRIGAVRIARSVQRTLREHNALNATTHGLEKNVNSSVPVLFLRENVMTRQLVEIMRSRIFMESSRSLSGGQDAL